MVSLQLPLEALVTIETGSVRGIHLGLHMCIDWSIQPEVYAF